MRIRALAVACVAAGALGAVPATALAAGSTTTPTSTLPLSAPTTTTTTTTTATTPAAAPTTTTATTPTVAPKPKPKPKIAKGRAKLYLSGLFSAGKSAVTVPGRYVKVKGVIEPYRPGQKVLVQAIEHGRVFAHKRVTLRASKQRVYGGFTIAFKAPKAGLVAVKVTHIRSTALTGFTAERHYRALSESVGAGSTGAMVVLLQSRLKALHLYIPQTGVFDNGTELALDAYHRLLGEGEGDITANSATVTDLLDGKGVFHVRFPSQGIHAEGDLSDQVIAYMNGAKVEEILPISSGKPSTPTVLGSWRVYRKQPEYTSDGMYFSNFFTGGYAIHGYDPAPDYPASHGCMRLPISDAIFAYNLLSVGDWVDTYDT
jgi:hypothetical protein